MQGVTVTGEAPILNGGGREEVRQISVFLLVCRHSCLFGFVCVSLCVMGEGNLFIFVPGILIVTYVFFFCCCFCGILKMYLKYTML